MRAKAGIVTFRPLSRAHASTCGTTWSASPQTPAEPSSAGVNATLPADELTQGLGIRLVGRRIPHDAAPFAPGPFVRFRRVGGAPNDGGRRVFPIRDFQPLQAQ